MNTLSHNPSRTVAFNNLNLDFGSRLLMDTFIMRVENNISEEGFVQRLLTPVEVDKMVGAPTSSTTAVIELVFDKPGHTNQVGIEQIESQYLKAITQTMTHEDRFLFKLLRATVDRYQCNECNYEQFDVSHMVRLGENITGRGMPVSEMLMNSQFWSILVGNNDFAQLLDPAVRMDMVTNGILGHIIGRRLSSDAFRHPDNRILEQREMWAFAARQYLGTMTCEITDIELLDEETRWVWKWKRRTDFQGLDPKHFSVLRVHDPIRIGQVNELTFQRIQQGV